MSVLEEQLKNIIYNEGLSKALDYAYDNIRFYRKQVLNNTNSRIIYIENYKFLKHFIEEANRKEKWSTVRRNRH